MSGIEDACWMGWVGLGWVGYEGFLTARSHSRYDRITRCLASFQFSAAVEES